jgi:hypothetical protein
MRIFIAFAVALVAVAPAALARDLGRFQVRTDKGKALQFRVLECGRILGEEGIEYVRNYDAQGNKVFSHAEGRQLMIRQSRIPLEAGTAFGCSVYVPRVPSGHRLTIEHVAVMPEGAAGPSQTAREIVYPHKYSSKRVSNPRFWWHSFQSKPAKDLEGEWRFEIRHDGQTLISESFHLSRPGP